MGAPAVQLPLLDEHRFTWSAAERAVWRRPRRLTVTEWAEATVKLPPSVTSLAGYFRCAHTPYLREVMDTWALAHVRRVVFCAGPQTGKTLSAYLPLLYAMHRAPGPALLAMSGQEGARKVVKDYLTPILHESPALRRLLSPDPDDTTSYRIRLQNGMRLYAAWATSPALLKTFPARYGIGDEVDDWPTGAGVGKDAGDPEALFDVRLRTYPFTSKLMLVSSPGGEGGIWAKLAACAEARLYLPRCPECGTLQRMVWRRPDDHDGRGGFVFLSGADPAELEGTRLAAYACAGCGSHWDDAARDRAVRDGHWQAVDRAWLADPAHWHAPLPPPPARRVERPVSVGFHLAAWCSRLVPLAKVAAEFLRAHREADPARRVQKLKAWTNHYPALPWVEIPAAPVEVEAVLALRDDRPAGVVPEWAVVLLLTADVQADGVYYELRAWGEDRRSAGVQHGFALKDFAAQWPEGLPECFPRSSDWLHLRALLVDTYRTATGVPYRPQVALIDSRYRGKEVVDFCRALAQDPAVGARVYPSLGLDELRGGMEVLVRKLDTYPGTSTLIPGGLRRFDVSNRMLKDALALRLSLPLGEPGSWALHADTREDYARHLTGEYFDESLQRWLQRGRQPNHWWDCAVLQLALVHVAGTDGSYAAWIQAHHQAAAPPAPRFDPPAANPLAGRNLNPRARR